MRILRSIAVLVTAALAAGAPLAADDVSVDGIVESTAGGFRFADGSLQSRAFGEEQNRIVVAKSGGDHSTVQAALDAITAAADASADNRYVVEVGPGLYNEQVTLISFVTVRGSGARATKITFAGSATDDTGTLIGADEAIVSHLTVENTGGADFAIAVYCGGSSPRLSWVSLEASGATDADIGLLTTGVSSPVLTDSRVTVTSTGTDPTGVALRGSAGSEATVRRVEIEVTGGSSFTTGLTLGGDGTGLLADSRLAITTSTGAARAINASEGDLDLEGVTADASQGTAIGIYLTFADVTIRGSTIRALDGTTNYGVFNLLNALPSSIVATDSRIVGATATLSITTGATVQIGASQLSGGAVAGAGAAAAKCFAVYDENYTASQSTCP